MVLVNIIIVSSGEYLYFIDINTGAEIYEVPVSKDGKYVYIYETKVVSKVKTR